MKLDPEVDLVLEGLLDRLPAKAQKEFDAEQAIRAENVSARESERQREHRADRRGKPVRIRSIEPVVNYLNYRPCQHASLCGGGRCVG